MLEKVQLEKILFLDIETVPQVYQYKDVEENAKKLFEAKTRSLVKDDKTFDDAYNDRAGILAEFGKIICISVGFVNETRTGRQMRIKSFYHDDEQTLLKQFKQLLDEHGMTKYFALCGHNAKEFDFPYICRRMLINGMQLPSLLDKSHGKYPILTQWNFGNLATIKHTHLWLCCVMFLKFLHRRMTSQEPMLLESFMKMATWKE